MQASAASPARIKRPGDSRLDLPARNYTRPDALQHVRNMFEKALRYQLDGRIDVAVHVYERTLILNPDYAEAHNNLGVAWPVKAGSKTQSRITDMPSFSKRTMPMPGSIWVRRLWRWACLRTRWPV